MEGLHGIQLTAAGLEVYPRLVSPRIPVDYTPTTERVSTGVEGLDAMIGGGLWRGSSTLVIGPTGSGKTTMGLQYALRGVSQGEPALYVNFQENPTQLARSIQNLTSDFARMRNSGLHLMYASSVELQIDRIIVEIFQIIESGHVRRVVIDAIGDLAMAAGDSQRVHDYLYALVQQLTVRGVTTVLLMEAPALAPTGTVVTEFGRLSYMCDNLILLDIERGERIGRHLTVYKTRGSAHDDRVRRVTITAAGVRVE
jgi:circadian clock protein KaiC